MSDSTFNPDAFLDATTTEANTRRPPLPAGIDVSGVIETVTARPWQGKADPSKSGVALDLTIRIQVPMDQVATQGTDSITLRDGIMLDMNEGGQLDNSPGKNNRLRKYRDALGMNSAGTAFSPRAMIGRPLRVKIKHEEYEGELYDKVDSVAKA